LEKRTKKMYGVSLGCVFEGALKREMVGAVPPP